MTVTDRARIGIIGAGLMGHGIAAVFAAKGYLVAMYDPMAENLQSAPTRISKILADLDEDAGAVSNVALCPTLAAAVRQADVVFEAAPEKISLKQAIFADVERHAPRGALLASNTSVIPIHKITERMTTCDRALGTHWWNPPYIVPLVEVIEASQTAPQAVTTMIELLASVGKTPVHVKKDVPGFVGNRLQHALWREAIAIVQEGIADARTVDTVVKSSFGRRLAVLGPLENADLVGTDLTLDIHENVLPYLDRTPGPLPYLRELVADGKLGMKSGAGFRSWTEAETMQLRAAVTRHLLKMRELLGS